MLLANALAPLLIALDPWEGWKAIADSQKWQLARFEQDACTDMGVKQLERMVKENTAADPDRVYLVARGDTAPCVFYAASRVPDLWAAALAIGGNPRRAIDTNRLFSANLEMTPILWVTQPDPDRRKIPGIEERATATADDAVKFLAARKRIPFPTRVDYETGSTGFLRCYWVRIAQVDPLRRNDALGASRVTPGSGGTLAIGGFGYDMSKPGPGVEVVWLPPNYNGPLKLGDRIASIAGIDIGDGRDYAKFMDTAREEKAVSVMVVRGKERIRMETRLLLAKRDEALTVRFQAEVQPASKEILVISRGISGLDVTVPAAWAPAALNWNGSSAPPLDKPGCYRVLADKSGTVTTAPCPAQQP